MKNMTKCIGKDLINFSILYFIFRSYIRIKTDEQKNIVTNQHLILYVLYYLSLHMQNADIYYSN